MENAKQISGKILYALLFLVGIPAILWFWALYVAPQIRYPAIESPLVGTLIIVAGVLLMLWGMLALRVHGKGLPMNAFPPPEFVVKGPYRLFRHPIYWGFGILMIGVSIRTGSSGGLWLVTPITILGLIALVLGFEDIDLKQRFPNQKLRTILDLPEAEDTKISIRARLASLFWVIVMLFMGNFIVQNLAADTAPLHGEPLRLHPVLERPDLQFVSVALILLTPFILTEARNLRLWAVSSVIGLALSLFVALVFPAFGAQYISDKNAAGFLPICTVPVFLLFISVKAIYRQSLILSGILGILVNFLALVQLSNCQSASMLATSSALLFLIAANHQTLWQLLRSGAERIANSWQEWVFGKVRVINHGFYVGFGAFFGILFAGILAGAAYAWAILVFALIVIVFSALWAQIIEGSEKLKRPFGYYGALVGIIFASLAVWLMGVQVWVIIGVVSVIMPWVQAIGRLRCLVNGCCHGSPVDNPNIGIRFFHARSRVCGVSGLKGRLLHPTQLYSISWLFFVGFVLLALWNNQFSASFIFGLYLILTGIGRFVEEAYRGEVQTPVLRKLHLYQWTAIISVAIGMFMTLIPAQEMNFQPGFGWQTLVAAAIGGLFTFFAMGVDFPYSNARFSRLV